MSPNTAVYEDFTVNGETVPFYYSRSIQLIKPNAISATLGSEVSLPTTVTAYTATGQLRKMAIIWDIASLDVNTAGEYVLTGTADGLTTTVSVHILPDDSSSAPLEKAPEIKGFQKSLDGSSIRFAAIINSLDYSSAGFLYNVNYNGTDLLDEKRKVETTVVFQSINSNVYGISQPITAESLGGTYIYAITFTGVPTVGTVVIELSAYAISIDGTTQYESSTFRVTFEDGVYVGWQATA